MNNTSLLGRPHFELVERYGYRENLIGRYETEEEAGKIRTSWLVTYERCRMAHGELIVRGREF